MIIPIRCFTCGKLVAHLFEDYKIRVKNGEPSKEIFESMSLDKYCCRRMLTSHVDLIDSYIKVV